MSETNFLNCKAGKQKCLSNDKTGLFLTELSRFMDFSDVDKEKNMFSVELFEKIFFQTDLKNLEYQFSRIRRIIN